MKEKYFISFEYFTKKQSWFASDIVSVNLDLVKVSDIAINIINHVNPDVEKYRLKIISFNKI